MELHLLRYVPGSSPVHRLRPATKLVAAVVLSLGVSIFPTWVAAAAVTVVLALAIGVARIPAGVTPRLPRWFLIGVAVTATLAMLSNQAPKTSVAGINVSLGALEEWTRLSVLGVLVFAAAALVGWTTPLADLPPAIGGLLRPLRWLRVPVDELSMALGLAVRCIPLLIDEIATLAAARRARRPAPAGSLDTGGAAPARRGVAARVHGTRRGVEDGIDLLVTAMASALRRAAEMAEAMEARGGTEARLETEVGAGARDRRSSRRLPPLADVVALAVTAAAVTVMAMS